MGRPYQTFASSFKVHISPLTKFHPENPCGVKRSHRKNFRNRTWRFPTIKLFQLKKIQNYDVTSGNHY